MCDVSVVIVSWNARDYLMECLESIEATRGGLEVEVIVVDNDSSDGSPDAVAERFPETVLLREKENHGFARANNLGIARARGRYLFLINSDVKVLPDCFQKLVAFLDATPEVGLAGPRILNADGSLQASARRHPSLTANFGRALFLDRLPGLNRLFPGSHLGPDEHQGTRDVPILVGCFWAVRREALEQVGGLDENFFMYGEDNDWSRRFAEGGWRVVYHPEPEAIHYGGASSGNAPARFFVVMKQSESLFWRKHRGEGARWIAALILFGQCLLRYLIWVVAGILRTAEDEKVVLMRARYAACMGWILRGAPLEDRRRKGGDA